MRVPHMIARGDVIGPNVRHSESEDDQRRERSDLSVGG